MPERISMPRLRTSSASAAAHLIARSGWGKVAKKPSPAWSSFPPEALEGDPDEPVEP
jgi:hypothetical protein